MIAQPAVGSIVRCREREWVVLPSTHAEVVSLRPLAGDDGEACGVYLPLVEAGLEKLEPAGFPLPAPEDAGDAVGCRLLWDAARLTLRDGAGPLRSLARISVRPRAYQLLPLLMALKLDPVRLLIADDVGVGKTVEALLIARELLDRGEIDRLCMLCPPYLCDQWQRELAEKFHLEAEVVRSGTASRLERGLPPGEPSIFKYYRHLVVSIDYAKSDRHWPDFVTHCPDFVIVDEAHGAAQPGTASKAQQQRHELLKRLAANEKRHLVLLTATPHSGIEASFVSLLALLRPSFAGLSFRHLSEQQRKEVARHFVQRRRPDIVKWLDEVTSFPERESVEETYELSPAYRELFEQVYRFSRELVRTGETFTGWRRRIRYWAALSILRCVMSSPPAAVAALSKKAAAEGESPQEADDAAYVPFVYDPTDEEPLDVEPSHVVEQGEAQLSESGRRRLRQFARLAEELMARGADTKIARCSEIVARLLRNGFHPIVWCRYIETAKYVAAELARRLASDFPDLAVEAVTGNLPEEDRSLKVEELAKNSPRVLVATDCLSEGINLQEHFTAVLHYDLPWNPNRLEQREGRVDRFGQRAPKVRAVCFYGRDNPVDGAVLEVLLRKAAEIRKSLGVAVPVPAESESVLEAVFKAIMTRAEQASPYQLRLFADETILDFHRRWDEAAGREKESRSRFAQAAIKPDEVERELAETDAVLGDPEAVRRFVRNACQRLGLGAEARPDGTYLLSMPPGLDLPYLVRAALPATPWRVSFAAPPPKGAEWLGRNHPFVSALAQWLLESALARTGQAPAARCGVVRTSRVERRTVLLLLRLRHLLEQPARAPLLAEEVTVAGLAGFPPDRLQFLPESQARELLAAAEPEAPVSPQERREVLAEVLGWWEALLPHLKKRAEARAQRVLEAHRRVRAAAGMARRGLAVRPQLPPDLLGVLVLLPVPKGVVR